jgi:hypothetical protein
VVTTPLALSVFGLFLSPVIPLIFSWVRSPGLTEKRNLAFLCLATFSSMWLIAGILFPIALGRYYSDLRFTIIYANLFVMLACATAVFWRKSRLRITLGLACLMQAVIWFFVAAVNAAV